MLLLLYVVLIAGVWHAPISMAWTTPALMYSHRGSDRRHTGTTCIAASDWTDGDLFDGDSNNIDGVDFASLLQERSGNLDYTAIQTRQFSLGTDLVVTDYVGNMGFDEGKYCLHS